MDTFPIFSQVEIPNRSFYNFANSSLKVWLMWLFERMRTFKTPIKKNSKKIELEFIIGAFPVVFKSSTDEFAKL